MKKMNTIKEFIDFLESVGSSIPKEIGIDHMTDEDRVSVCAAIKKWLEDKNNFFECYEYNNAKDRTYVAVQNNIEMSPLRVPAISNALRQAGYNS